MSLSKPFLILTVLAVVTLLGGGLYVFTNLDSLAQNITERIASDTLGVRVDIGSMEISLKDRKAVVRDITVANPSGFKKAHAMTVDFVSVDLGNISKELINFDDIAVRGTNVNLEVKERTTNLQALKNNIKTKPKDSGTSNNVGDAQDKLGAKLKVIIDRFEMSEARVSPSVILIGQQDLSPVAVPNIVLTGIGKRENGVLARDAIAQISKQLLNRFGSVASGAGFYQGMSADALKEMGVNQVNQIKDQISNEIGGKLKGLFGN